MSASFLQQLQLALPSFKVIDLSMLGMHLFAFLRSIESDKSVVGVLSRHPSNQDLFNKFTSGIKQCKNMRFIVFNQGHAMSYECEDMETIRDIQHMLMV